MSQEFMQNHLFKAFSQEQAMSRSDLREGTGLGLWISKKMVETMNGDLQVTSCVGQGSTFSFTLGLDCVAATVAPDRVDQFVSFSRGVTSLPSCHVWYESNMLFAAKQVVGWLSQLGFDPLLAQVSATVTQPQLITHSSFIVLLTSRSRLKPTLRSLNLSKGDIRLVYICSISDFQELERIVSQQRSTSCKVTCVPKPLGPIKLVRALESLLYQHELPIDAECNLQGVDRTCSLVPFSSYLNSRVPKCALLVDDNPVILLFLERLMQLLRIPYESARNGALAVDKFSSFPQKYDLVIMDHQMPVMHGGEAIRLMRQFEEDALVSPHHRCVIFTLSAVTPSDLPENDRLDLLLADEFLIKPATMKKLSAALSKYFPDVAKPYNFIH
jgi:two-component system sensor histidine kinase BarA